MFLNYLAIACALLGVLAFDKVAFSAFKKKAHGVNAAIAVLLHAFIVITVNARFVRYEPAVAPGTWIALLVMGVIADTAFLMYPAVVMVFNQHGLGVSLYLVVAEFAATIVLVVTLGLVTTATFTPG